MPKIIQPSGKVETCFHIQSVVCHRLYLRKEFWPSHVLSCGLQFFLQKLIATEIILTAKKVYLKPTLQCTYVNTAKRQHLYSCFHKSNNNNCYNLTGRARTVSPIKHTGLVPVRLGKQKVWPTYVWDRKHRAQRLRNRKNLGSSLI